MATWLRRVVACDEVAQPMVLTVTTLIATREETRWILTVIWTSLVCACKCEISPDARNRLRTGYKVTRDTQCRLIWTITSGYRADREVNLAT
jgi:hypothetical protein